MFKFKKIGSVLASVMFASSTIALAAAANYPAPFVQGGSPDVAVVYGSGAGSQADLVAATNIGYNLQTYVTSSGSSSSGSSVSGGDSVLLAKPSDPINLGNVVTTVFGTTVTEDDLELLLADGTYRNDENSEFEYEQRITLGTGLVFEYFSDSDYEDRTPTLGFNLTSNQMLLNYSLDFTTDAESDVSGGDLVDLETTTIEFFGKEYYISDVDNSTLDITLLDTANSATVREGETRTITVGTTQYDVSIDSFTDTGSTASARLLVNGELTNTLSNGQTQRLDDGSYLGAKQVTKLAIAGEVGSVEFSIGSGKLELINGQSIQVNDQSINTITSEIRRGTTSGGKEKIDRINLVWTLDDDAFVTPTSSLVMPAFGSLKFSTGGVVRPSEEMTYVRDGSTTYMNLETEIKDGEVTIPIMYANASGAFVGIGKDSGELLNTGNNSLSIVYNHTAGDRMFVGSWNSSLDSESYLLRLNNFKNDSGVSKTTIQRHSGGSWSDACTDRRAGDTCTLGSLTLTVNSVDGPISTKTAQITAGAGGSFNHLYTKSGLKVFLPYNATTGLGAPGSINLSANGPAGHAGNSTGGQGSFRLVFMEENRNDNVANGNQFNVTLGANSDNEIEAESFEGEKQEITDPDNSDITTGYVYSDLATGLTRTGSSSDQRYVTINYAGSESYAEIYLTDSSASVVVGSGGGIGVPIRDSEISSVSGKHVVVVGGSCVNTYAATLLGSSSPLCGSDFTARTGVSANQYLIETFSRTGGKVATLVAGYNAGDTTNAATYLTTQSPMTNVGNKYVGTTSTQASIQTATA